MLQFTITQDTPASAITTGGLKAQGQSAAALRTHVTERNDLSESTRKSYLGAIDKWGDVLNKPLTTIDADIASFNDRFTKTGFDLENWPTDTAYLLWRRRVNSALKTFLGVHAAIAALRAQEDQWTQLLNAVQPLTQGKVGVSAQWHPMKLAALRSFSIVARAYNKQPRDVDEVFALLLESEFADKKREANRVCLMRLDDLRAFPDVLPFLPLKPIGFTPARRQQLVQGLSPLWEDQLVHWIHQITCRNWDPVSQSFSDKHEKHAKVMLSASRTFCRLAVKLNLLDQDQSDLRVLLANDDAVTAVAAHMFHLRHAAKKDGHLEPRSSRKYLKTVRQIRKHLGIDNTELALILANNQTARDGQKADKTMTKKNRKFCERLIDKLDLRRRFLLSFRTLRGAAQTILDQAQLEGRKLTKQEVARVRMLGAAACFSAIEIGGAPIRVKNAMALTIVGEDAQMKLPKKDSKPIEIFLPAAVTKNNVDIEFPIHRNKFGYHDTIHWYVKTIRPLFPYAEVSPYLFPAIKNPGKPLAPGWFRGEFATLMRSVVNLPMTPHQMRHGQVSLLLNAHPNEIEVIAKRIDDTAATLRNFYGFISALKLVERGQNLLKGIMDELA